MSKLTREQKIEIYHKRRTGVSLQKLAIEYDIRRTNIAYLIRLIDKHGEGILRSETNRYYSPILKEEIINKVLLNKKSVCSIAIEHGLSSAGILTNWIKSYKENGYAIVERKKERTSSMKITQSKNEYKEMTLEEKNKYNEKRIQYLEAENEYLKKLQAVVQARKNRQPKIK